ncbi:MAG: 2-hydroxymuconic semialdehyde dehydrogenase, partial [Solirubrobacterales bacterium]|nr:2-hydroxymuconic semialdehyde dehydrogenase [Solirubrobacterales bacterium]
MTLTEAATGALHVNHLIGGAETPASSGEVFESLDPHDGSVVAVAPRGTDRDAGRAVGAARRAFDDGPWPNMPPRERARYLHRLADLLEANAEELVALETRDTGRPVRVVRGYDVERSAHNLRFFADYATLAEDSSVASSGRLSYVLRPPAGVVVAISPWNLPLMLSTWKIGPALAFGNTVVLKPAEQTPATVARLGQLAVEAGMPA